MVGRTAVRTLPEPGSPRITLRVLDLTDPGWDVAAAAADLSPAERARADRGTPAVRRRRVLVRSALRSLLGGLLDLPARAVPLQTDRGRPFLVGCGLSFSCSAGGDVALVAVSADVCVGVDVERCSGEDAAVAAGEGWLAPVEQARIAALPPSARPGAVTRCWTQKEAVLKARGTGILRPPSDVVTPVADAGWIGPWWVAAVPVPPGHLASLACDAALPPGALGVVP
ncbi:4-phosphopantetheinyl transferase [Geodermatophilus sp. TF02-6]|uniref:4'-phosphopantetheinyl transferase family protein n=1 Tax=Geodermatophilus sp. TF02-6 TaxID=2250575 RepID=UPI000DEA093D|nr:4'-phosphopantetheinyl transferase superfamily protein [Geodermatophilus sp. TF02-6]RBY77689.1 4-phosphopantetheinyl transferase [Geodermatophilus sp. TF02-6]